VNGGLAEGGAEPIFQPEPDEAPDRRSASESVKLASGESLEDAGRLREHWRHQEFRDEVNKATLWLLRLIVACIGLGIVIFAWHLLTPPALHWMSDASLDKLQTILVSAIFSSALTGYANRRMAS
jgi:hypothetical protein